MVTVGNMSCRFDLHNNNKYITRMLNLLPMLYMNMSKILRAAMLISQKL